MKDNNNILLIGAGGHCKVIIDLIQNTSQFTIAGITDKSISIGTDVLDQKVVSNSDDFSSFLSDTNNFFIAFGAYQLAKIRERIHAEILKVGGELPILISNSAYVSQFAEIEEGTLILNNASVNAEVTIGKSSIINNNANIDHEATIGDFTHISTGAMINGNCSVGNRCFIGSNATIIPGIKICDDVIIGAGCTVINDISEPGTYVGSPVKKIS